MLPVSDYSESSSSNTESDQRITEVLSENSLNRLSETTPSTRARSSLAPLSNERLRPSSEDQADQPKRAEGKQLWPKGRSGNPAGRPKGTKNQITILKEALELRLRNKAAYKIEKVLDKAVELALSGDRLMIKLLLELHMSKASHTEDTTAGKSQVAVVIQNLTEKGLQGNVLDVTPNIKVSKDE